MKYEYTYKPYQTGCVTYSGDDLVRVAVEVDEDSSLMTMIASEPVLARDWDSPEENEAWNAL